MDPSCEPLEDGQRVGLALWISASEMFMWKRMSGSANEALWGTKGQLNRAGKKIRIGEELTTEEAYALDAWRGAHGYVLNTFKPLLWRRVAGKEIVVAQRLKRRSTIIDKLFREPTMELARMDDIAGSRLIFKDINSLEAFRQTFHKSKFNHKLRHEVERYNYILQPKASGYRGVHEIYVL
jgi:putative GTP pyrophosphokinase